MCFDLIVQMMVMLFCSKLQCALADGHWNTIFPERFISVVWTIIKYNVLKAFDDSWRLD
jgi:hypothetical protein